MAQESKRPPGANRRPEDKVEQKTACSHSTTSPGANQDPFDDLFAARAKVDRAYSETGDGGHLADWMDLSAVIYAARSPGDGATSGQVAYLKALRKRHGLEIWNKAKADLGIKTPGTEKLSKAEASRLIAALIGERGRSS